MVEAPIRILQNGYTFSIYQYGRRSGGANRETNPTYKPLGKAFCVMVKSPTHRALILAGRWGQ